MFPLYASPGIKLVVNLNAGSILFFLHTSNLILVLTTGRIYGGNQRSTNGVL